MIAAVSQIASKRGRAVKLTFELPGTVTASVHNPDSGSARQSMECEFVGLCPFEIGFNAGYIADMVEMIGADRMAIKLTDADGPARFEPVGAPVDGVAVLGVLMPMRV